MFEQLEHPIDADASVNDCFRPVSRFFDRILLPEELLTALPEAMRVLTDAGEMDAVTLALPQDVQAQAHAYRAQFHEERTWHGDRRPPERRRVTEAVQLPNTTRGPLLIVGGGRALMRGHAGAGQPVRCSGDPAGRDKRSLPIAADARDALRAAKVAGLRPRAGYLRETASLSHLQA